MTLAAARFAALPIAALPIAALSVAALSLAACSAARKEAAPPAPHSALVVPAAGAGNSERGNCPPAVETKVEEDGEAEAEIEVESEVESETLPDPAWEAEWSWIKQRFPESGQYELPQAGLLTQLLDWAKPGEEIAVYDRACRPATVTRGRDKLYGHVHQGFQFFPGTPEEMSESISEIQIGWRFDEFGSNWTQYRRDRKGRWVQFGSGGLGGAREVEHLLSAVTTDAAWFDDAAISLRIVCHRLVEHESRCTGGGRRTCQRCEGWGPSPTSHESGFGIHRQPAKRRVQATSPSDCSVPCASIEEPPDVVRANAALREREFRTSLDPEPKPLLFRTEAACREHTKKHPFKADDLDAWRGHADE